MHQIAVCDDEQMVCDMVSETVSRWKPDVKVQCFLSGEALLSAYDFFDVIFLDIDMQGINGIMWQALLRCMRSSTCSNRFHRRS